MRLFFCKIAARLNTRLVCGALDGLMMIDTRFLTVLLCALVMVFATGCNMPSAKFSGLPATAITVDGSDFDVRVNGNQAEAIRTNMEYAPRFGPIRDRAARAMAEVSGCEVTHVAGDQALAVGKLDCG